jgi:hypothetical protein
MNQLAKAPLAESVAVEIQAREKPCYEPTRAKDSPSVTAGERKLLWRIDLNPEFGLQRRVEVRS